MSIIPVRGMGTVGIVADFEPHDAPFLSWTDGINIRFAKGKASRYSVFKLLNSTYSYTKSPVGILEGGTNSGDGFLVTVFNDGTMEQLNDGTITDVTPSGTLGLSNSHITKCLLGGVVYVNRGSDVPVYRIEPQDGSFTPIPGWDINDRCRSLRSFKDYLIAINVTKGVTEFEGMIKWSNAAQFGAPPADWDVNDDASLAGENILNDIKGPLIDGMEMGRSFIIYGAKQVYRMDYIGEPFVFDQELLFPDRGVLAENCVANVGSLHYVFGQDDIYMHDGVQPVSVADGIASERIYLELDRSKASRSFVYHDEYHKEVVFCYPSIDDRAAWSADESYGCNRAFVYNYRDKTTSFIDMPGVLGSEMFSQVNSISWADEGTWNEQNRNWASMRGQKPDAPVVVSTGNGVVSGKPYFMDTIRNGRLPNEVANELFWPAFLEKTHMDLDEMQAGIYGTKQINGIYPQITSSNPEDHVSISLGCAANLNFATEYKSTKDFKPWEDIKQDGRVSGRYLGFRFDFPAGVHADLSGFDLDLTKVAER